MRFQNDNRSRSMAAGVRLLSVITLSALIGACGTAATPAGTDLDGHDGAGDSADGAADGDTATADADANSDTTDSPDVPVDTAGQDADASDSDSPADAALDSDSTIDGGADTEDTTATDTTGDAVADDGTTSDAGNDAATLDATEDIVEDTGPPFCFDGVLCDDGDLCCEAGDICLGDTCATPLGACLDSFDCPADSFCEPVVGQCLPQPDTLSCQVIPSFEALEIGVEWSFTDEQIISSPMVADLDADGTPDVVVNLSRTTTADWEVGEVAALDGRTGAVKWRVPHNPDALQWGSQGRSTLAVGDVSGDGLPDVIYAGREVSGRSLIVAVDHTGTLLWTSHDADGDSVSVRVDNGAITLANFDADPMAEVVIGAMLVDDDGTVLWNEGGIGPEYGTNQGYIGGISVVAELDGDPTPEIVSGKHAWDVTIVAGPTPTATVVPLWEADSTDGYPAVADLDNDGTPEVVLVGARNLVIVNGDDGLPWCGRTACSAPGDFTQPLALPGGASNNRGGPPTIADFDNDGRPEIGIAGGYAYTVYDINRPGEDIVRPAGSDAPAPGAIYPRWSQVTQDLSSNATGSSVFDFQGDGAAEVVYADECFVRVYDGRSGDLQLEIQNSSATIHEYPIVVDVDADGNSEILIVANSPDFSTNCGVGYTGRRGLFVYGDPGNQWVRTRRVWPQHSYHVTNATSAGNVPLNEVPHWASPETNNFRQNVQGEGVFNAPDLRVNAIVLDDDRCSFDELGVIVRLGNAGTIGVAAGIPVSLYRGTDATGELLGSTTTTEGLLPGGQVEVRFTIPVPVEFEASVYVVIDGGAAGGATVECDEANNEQVQSLIDACGI